ncbi:MAG TPA: MXAN_5187 C-terminal domain-containing protein [Polyangia bacterium]
MPESQGNQPPDIGQLLDELSIKIERVKQLYEQYFMGIEKIEPGVPRKEVTRAMLLLQQQYIRNTGLRFKFNTMLQKWNIYVTYWNRTLREIENGTYVRHVARMKRKGQPVADEPARGAQPTKRFLDKDSEPLKVSAVAAPSPIVEEKTEPGLERVPARTPTGTTTLPPPIPKMPPPIPRPAARSTPVPLVPGMSELELRALHRKFVDARRASGETEVTYQALVQSLARQVGKVLEQPGVRSVRFDVAVQNGRAVLKAIPKK